MKEVLTRSFAALSVAVLLLIVFTATNGMVTWKSSYVGAATGRSAPCPKQ